MAVPFTDSEASFVTQFIGVAATGAFVVITTSVVWVTLKYTVGIRCSEEDEMRGLDVSEIGMEAYPDFQSTHIGGSGIGVPGVLTHGVAGVVAKTVEQS
jgi:Amt family ammonium transporter